MARQMGNRVLARQVCAQAGQLRVLDIFESVAFQALKLDPDRIIIALMASSVMGFTSMPGAVLCADKLPQCTIATDIEVRGDLQAPNLPEVRVCVPVQLVREQVLHFGAAVLAWGQTDGVNHQQVDTGILGSGTEIGRRQLGGWQVPTLVPKTIFFKGPRVHGLSGNSDGIGKRSVQDSEPGASMGSSRVAVLRGGAVLGAAVNAFFA